MGAGSRPPKRRLIFLALTGTARNRRAVRILAASLGWLWGRLSALTPGAGRPVLAFYAPAADGKAFRWPSSVDPVGLEDALEPEDWPAAVARGVREADRMTASDVGWPGWEGVRVAPLNWSTLAEFFFDYAVMAKGLGRLLDGGAWTSCTIVTGYPQLGRALRAEARSAGIRASSMALPPLRRPGGGTSPPRANGDVRPDSVRSARVLFVSESPPMREMFDRIEEAMDASGLRDFLRVQYVISDPPAPSDHRHLIWPRPDQIDLREVADAPTASISRVQEGLDTPAPAVDLILEGIEADLLPRQRAHLRRVRELFERVEPELVVVGNDRWWLGRAFTLVARSLGIPSLAVQDGIATDGVRFRTWSADRIAVNGRHLRDILVDAGCPEARIVEVGQPRYDRMIADSLEPTTPRPATDRPRVLFATQPNQDATYVRAVLEVLGCADVDVDLRPHPSTAPAALRELEVLADVTNSRWRAEGDVHEMVLDADLVLVQNSTVAVEAALLGKPVITANLTGSPPLVPYAELGISREATDVQALAELLEEGVAGRLPTIRSSDRTRRGVEYLLGPSDGNAAWRVVDVIRDMLAGDMPAGDDTNPAHTG